MKKKNLIWAGLGVIAAAVAAVFFARSKKEHSSDPPKKAPQLRVQNPGDQSEFTTAPSDSELG